jgi:hypothetical protein
MHLDALGGFSPYSLGLTGAASACFASSVLVGKKASSHASAPVMMFFFMVPCTLIGLAWLLLKGD